MAIGQHDPGWEPRLSASGTQASPDSGGPAEDIGRALCRLLQDFIETEVVPPAMRTAEQGIDPTPILDSAAGILRAFADSLARPDLDGDKDPSAQWAEALNQEGGRSLPWG
jgi:hypothetical protein